MPMTDSQASSLHDRTLEGVQQVLDRALARVEGFELFVVRQAVQSLHPRVAQRIRGASEEDLRAELKYLHELLATILREAPPQRAPTAKPRRSQRLADGPAPNASFTREGRRGHPASRRASARRADPIKG